MDKGKPDSKRHLVVDRQGVPLAGQLTAANVHDSLVFEALIDGIPPIKRPRGRPRKRPAKRHADKGSDYRKCRQALTRRRIKVRIARKGIESRERLTVRYERRADIHEAFLHLGCALICLNYLSNEF